jgi:hypothetical protein
VLAGGVTVWADAMAAGSAIAATAASNWVLMVIVSPPKKGGFERVWKINRRARD